MAGGVSSVSRFRVLFLWNRVSNLVPGSLVVEEPTD